MLVLEDHINLGGGLCRMRAATQDGTVVVRLSGEFDLSCEEAFPGELGRMLNGDTGSLVVDLSELTFIDSTGLRMLVSLDSMVREEGLSFTVMCQEGQVRRVLRETGLDGVLPLVERPIAVPTAESPS